MQIFHTFYLFDGSTNLLIFFDTTQFLLFIARPSDC